MRYSYRVAVIAIALVILPRCGPAYNDVANLANPNTTIVCFGDSLTRGYGASAGMDYPSQLATLLGRDVINAGHDGDTTADAKSRLESDVLEASPRLVIVGLAGNDLLQKRPKNETLADLESIVTAIAKTGAMVVLLHAKFGLFDDPYKDGMEDIAERHGALVVYGVLDDIVARPSRMYDQIHPNDTGYAIMAERVHAVVGPLLEVADAARREEV